MDEREVNSYIEKYPEEWLITAIVEESIGYFSPTEAKQLIEDWKNGERKCYYERCIALYDCDLGKMLASDFKSFEFLWEHAHEDALKTIGKVKWWLSLPPDDERDLMLSLAYPTT